MIFITGDSFLGYTPQEDDEENELATCDCCEWEVKEELNKTDIGLICNHCLKKYEEYETI